MFAFARWESWLVWILAAGVAVGLLVSAAMQPATGASPSGPMALVEGGPPAPAPGLAEQADTEAGGTGTAMGAGLAASSRPDPAAGRSGEPEPPAEERPAGMVLARVDAAGAGAEATATGALASPARPAVPRPAGAVAATPTARLDLNVAGPEELSALPGIGPALAQRIVAYRTQRGPFAAVDDLLAVPGIGPKTLERLRPWVEVGGAEPARVAEAAEGSAP